MQEIHDPWNLELREQSVVAIRRDVDFQLCVRLVFELFRTGLGGGVVIASDIVMPGPYSQHASILFS